MNTPQEFEPLAEWMWGDDYVLGKTSLTDAECIEALNRLVEKGYGYALAGTVDGHGVGVFMPQAGKPMLQIAGSSGCPTINQAVEQAIAALIKAERGEGE